MGKPAKVNKLLHAPFTLHDQLLGFIDEEIEHAKAGKDAHIIIKCNALTEQKLIDKLYDASQAGVKIELILRSMCCLRPQVKGLSENITVRSVVGRFLEHTQGYISSMMATNACIVVVLIGWTETYFIGLKWRFRLRIKSCLSGYLTMACKPIWMTTCKRGNYRVMVVGIK